jgi:hypothetical protein
MNTPDEFWSAVNDKEFTIKDIGHGPGTGLYFYEKDASRFCIYLIYGSGLPVVGYIKYKITIDEIGSITILEIEPFVSEILQDPSMKETFDFRYTRKGIIFDGDLFVDRSFEAHHDVIDEVA